MKLLDNIQKAIVNGDVDSVEALTEMALDQDILPKEILDSALIGGMDIIGAGWKRGDIFIPEVLKSAKAMKAGLIKIKPALLQGNGKLRGRIVIGTVKGDLHDIGKNIVAMMFEANGFEVFDLGVDVSADIFVRQARDKQADIVGVSALLSTTLGDMAKTVAALQEEFGDQLKTMVGGAPVSQPFADKIRASAYAPDAVIAVELAKQLVTQ